MKNLAKYLLFGTFLLTACLPTGLQGSAVVPIALEEPITISNEDYDLEIHTIKTIDSKFFGDRTISLNDKGKETHVFYELQMQYTNKGEEARSFFYKNIVISIPEVEDPGDAVLFVGYCVQGDDAPQAEPERCAYVPASKPGTYGVTGVYLMDVYKAEPGESSDIYFYIFLSKDQQEIEISFKPPEPETEE